LTSDFAQNALQDGGKNVLELMHINSSDGIARLQDEGYKLANKVAQFDVHDAKPWPLIDEGYLKIYVEFETTTQNADPATTTPTTDRQRPSGL